MKEPGFTTKRERFLLQVQAFLKDHSYSGAITIPEFAGAVGMSERQFHRKIKEYTGLTPGKYIRGIRLDEAKELIEKNRYITIREVVNAVGFTKISYFTQLFIKRFGASPDDLIKSHD